MNCGKFRTDGLDNHVNGGGNYGFCSEACIPSVSTRLVEKEGDFKVLKDLHRVQFLMFRPGIAFAVPEVNQRSNLRCWSKTFPKLVSIASCLKQAG